MREIGFDEIGFNVLAYTHNMCYALSLQNWQLEKKNICETEHYKKINSLEFGFCETVIKQESKKKVPCFSLQQSRGLKTDLVISPKKC